MRIRAIYFMLSLCGAALLGACTDHTDNPADDTLVSEVPLLRYRVEQITDEAGTATATRQASAAATRQTATDTEKNVSNVTLLFFDKNRDEMGTFRGVVELSGLTNQDAENIYFNRPLDFSAATSGNVSETQDYDVLALANNNSINSLKTSAITAAGMLQLNATTLRDAKAKLLYNFSDFNPAKDFLMSAQGSYTADNKVIELSLRRVVAKVCIKASSATADFIIDEIRFGNSRTHSYVADLDGDYPPALSEAYVGRVELAGADNTAKRQNQYNTGLSGYVFETYSNTTAQSDKVTLCVILKVRLAVDNYIAPHYFRYNLNVRASGTQRIYRNAYYEYVVSGFSSAGFETPDEAINSSRRDVLVLEGTSWNDAEGGAFGYAPDGKMVQVDKYAITKRFIDLRHHKDFPGLSGQNPLTSLMQGWNNATPLTETLTLKWYYRNGAPMPVAEYPANGSRVFLREKAATGTNIFSSITAGTDASQGGLPTWIVTPQAYGTTTLELCYWNGEGDPKPDQTADYEVMLEIPATITYLEPSQLEIPNSYAGPSANGHDYLLSERNLGADSPYTNGSYFSRKSPFHDPCPEGWRLPTFYELNQLLANTTYQNRLLVNENGISILGFDGAATPTASTPPVRQLVIPQAGAKLNGSLESGYKYWTADFEKETGYNIFKRKIAVFDLANKQLRAEVPGYDGPNGNPTDPDYSYPVRCIADETPYVLGEYKDLAPINLDYANSGRISGFYETRLSTSGATIVCASKVIGGVSRNFREATQDEFENFLMLGLLPEHDTSGAKIGYAVTTAPRTWYGYLDSWTTTASTYRYYNVWSKRTDNINGFNVSKWYGLCIRQ